MSARRARRQCVGGLLDAGFVDVGQEDGPAALNKTGSRLAQLPGFAGQIPFVSKG